MMAAKRTIRIATRESQLALWQAHHLSGLLRVATDAFDVQLVPVSTIGDRDRSGPLREMGGQGVFTREVQRLVLEDRADVAVHSLKDLPTESTDGLALAGVPERAPRFDALILPAGRSFDSLHELPAGSRIGTGSPRRQAQLLSVRADLQMCEIRGNVDTRLSKLDSGEYDAIVLAEAGLRRLELQDRISDVLQPPHMLPAVGQAALGIECRADDVELIDLLTRISDPSTMQEVTAERACLNRLRAGCHAPLGVHCTIEGHELSLQAVVLSLDGAQRYEAQLTMPTEAALDLGHAVADQLLERGAASVLGDNA